VEGFDKFLREFFVLLLEGLQVPPLVGIQEIQEVEQLPDIVIQRRLRKQVSRSNIIGLRGVELTPVMIMRWIEWSSESFLKIKLLSLLTETTS